MCKTTTDASSIISNGLLRIPVACPTGTGGDEVSILVFDPDHLINNVTESVDAWRLSLKLFFNELKSMNGLPDEASQALQPFKFRVVYHDRNSTPEERNGFGMMDFPVYLVEGEGGFTNPMSLAEGIALLEAHKLPEASYAIFINKNTGFPDTTPIDIKKSLEIFVQHDSDEIALGFGLPGMFIYKPIQMPKNRTY
ncbi:MAG: hypothetical protein IPN76_33365 [Saprospiraceae bacterium]|nr:hypothetical protein [Saprospiraceae bacterium]